MNRYIFVVIAEGETDNNGLLRAFGQRLHAEEYVSRDEYGYGADLEILTVLLETQEFA